MMDRLQFCRSLAELLTSTILSEELFDESYRRSEWFDRENIIASLDAVVKGLLSNDVCEQFVDKYRVQKGANERSVAIVMAGNIPFVGAADIIYAVLAGYGNIYLKFSSKDYHTMLWFTSLVQKVVGEEVIIEEYNDQKVDKVIATGSDNSGRYFRHKFGGCDLLIRDNRSSVAIIDDKCSNSELELLWNDLFLRYGQGCRNITQLFIPSDFDINLLADIWRGKKLDNIHYNNVYKQHKALLTMQNVKFVDLGYAVMVENNSLFAPLSQINYTIYSGRVEFDSFVEKNRNKLQCILDDTSLFGSAQFPTLFDFADGVDVMKFLAR